jgi:hypothetical protein
VGRRARRRLDAHRGNYWFLPNAIFIVSSCIGASEDAVSHPRNRFHIFASLSSFIDLPCHHFCLGGMSFNVDRNHHKCPLGVPLGHVQPYIQLLSSNSIMSLVDSKTDKSYKGLSVELSIRYLIHP